MEAEFLLLAHWYSIYEMGTKRPRYSDATTTAPSKRPKVDAGLAKIWENLADEDEEIRLHAAYDLATKHCNSTDLENARIIARRLFRGVCSSRKSARLGFYLALVGALSEKGKPFGTTELSLSEVISLLETQTTPEPGTSGQDERDHYYGRLVACKAVFETQMLAGYGTGPDSGWSKIFDIMCNLMAQKPWLRAEASSIICSAIVQAASVPAYSSKIRSEAISQAFRHLEQHRLVRTIDGVRIWLQLQEDLPEAKLPRDVWTSDDPLSIKDLPVLKKALLDTRASNTDADDTLGTSIWSQKLHEAWTLVFRRLSKHQPKGQVPLKDFWQAVVEDGLFNPSATPERKFTGFLVLSSALREVASSSVPPLFSKNLMASMIQALRSADAAYLQNIIHKVFSELRNAEYGHDMATVEGVIEGLLIGSDFADFDVLTKTKTVSALFEIVSLSESEGIGKHLISWLRRDPRKDKDLSKVASRRKNILNVLQRATCQSIRKLGSSNSLIEDTTPAENDRVLTMVRALIKLKRTAHKQDSLPQPYDESTHAVLNEKTLQILETLLAVSSPYGLRVILEIVAELEAEDFQAEEGIRDTLSVAWKQFYGLQSIAMKQIPSLPSSDADTRKAYPMTTQQGIALLLAILIFEVYDGDGESAELLGDATSMAEDVLARTDVTKVADHIIDIVFSFMSRSSKLHRRVGSLIFEAFASHMSQEGLTGLTDILDTKEGREGQEELFENGEFDMDDAGSGEEGASSEDSSMGSDVEVFDVADGNDEIDGSGSESSSNQDDDDSESGEDEEDVENEELTNFESALASALGTRKLNPDDLEDVETEDSSDAGSDMSDSQMMALDTKLAEVFRNQQNAASAQRVRKEEMRSAKENVVNLKNRAMDLIELFLRSQQARGAECVELLGALLKLAGTTGTQQLANRATEMIRSYVQKAKGIKLPKVLTDKETKHLMMHQLRAVHLAVVRNDVSNAVIGTAGQLNVLLCKLLAEAGERDVRAQVKKISIEAGSRADIKRKAMQEFWSRYDAWIDSFQQKEKKAPKPLSVASNKDRSKQRSASETKTKSKKKVA